MPPIQMAMDSLTGEFHIFGTNLSATDTDGDFLDDGREVLILLTNPLVKDNDTDMDGFYWFEDCNDTNSSIYPNALELLDGIDNNCDGEADETFNGTDADADGLLDLVEFLEIGTDPFDDDTDGDGLRDGIEVLSTFTNPFVIDPDADQDGFRWFLDCDDNDSARSPNALENWNGLDDNCDGVIDEGIDRAIWITPGPLMGDVFLNATNDSLELGVVLELEPLSIQRLNITALWYRNQTLLGQGLSFGEMAHNCQQLNTTFSQELCARNGTLEPYEIKVVVSDDTGSIEIKWLVTYTVWHPPVLEEAALEINQNSKGLDFGSYFIVWMLGGIVALLVIVLFITRRQHPNPKQQPRPKQAPPLFAPPPMYADVPAAPDFSQLGQYVPPPSNDWETNQWK